MGGAVRAAPAICLEGKTMIQDQLTIDAAPELWKDNIWDRLLGCLDERTVIPIVGPDLVRVDVDGTTVPLDQFIAGRLAQAYNLPLDGLPAERALNAVVCQLMRLNRERDDICDDIFQIMKGDELQPSRALTQLAEITDFNLFVSTTFDTLLEKAINQVRFNGAAGTLSIAYSPRRIEDLPAAKHKLPKPTVYQLMGKLSPTGAYVISEEDLLESVHALQSPERRPKRLFHELKENNLLILGEDFSDWLVRMFLRTTKGKPLSEARKYVEVLADSRSNRDRDLVSFLRHFSSRTRVFQAGGAVEFVDELWKRWKARRPVPKPSVGAQGGREVAGDAIFISYAREDEAAAEELKGALERAGLAVWFDKKSLKPGDSFNPRIEEYISLRCSCFLALISQTTERRTQGFFRREWNIALDRDREVYHGRRFIVPVVVDGTPSPRVVPTRFTQLQYTWLPGGRATEEFVEELRAIVSGP
jgi:TIR domain/SIR2-like domain